ncbi:Glycine/D-amino acid oxidase [Rhizobium mongolense subsp. loessense]|uniref:Glycine/D-amino acid oxidase n=1 Tax=Rhizobium mongolense subsp. loessense TaxID=158890 RepID=A0A1G4R2U6_9HYPH|nr:FAD-dependent oxidoreductase [Rhizobium mongolense]SCW50529.1 Glycine/D-amino acid oxidase [Rhizobium mongolense subsp. loessense]
MPASLAIQHSGLETRVGFFVDGAALKADRGMTIAAAMEASGCHDFSRGLKGEARGLFCGMGACHDCLVTVDGKISQRACMSTVEEGMQVHRPSPRPALVSGDLADLCPVPASIPSIDMDVLVIGAGPGGLATAEAAANAGASVTLIDERGAAGGQYFKQPSTSKAAMRLASDEQARSGADLIRRAQNAGVSSIGGTLVWGAENTGNGTTIACHGPQGAFYCKPRMVVIATGAYECPPAIPGWTKPGVMTTGAAQTLLRSYGTVPGGRIVIAGNGPLNIQVANEIRKAGGTVTALVEAAQAPWGQPQAALHLLALDKGLALHGAKQVAALRAAGIPILWESRVASIEGTAGVETVVVTGREGKTRIQADAILIGGNFVSANELSRLLGCGHEVIGESLAVIQKDDGETTIPHIHVIGEAAQFGGAHIAMLQGRLAGLAVARKLGFETAAVPDSGRRLARHRAFQSALWTVFRPARPDGGDAPPDHTIICRCEGLTYGTLKALGEHGSKDIATLKRLSRSGMGRCQSRYCGHATASIAGEARTSGETRGFLAPQMPLRPVPLAALAVEKPEWGGHKRALLPQKPPLENREPLPLPQTSTLVIGAGIAGLSTALFLAREGEEVTVLERAFPNSLASGGNAGSLHAQLLSFDHGARAEGGGGPAAQTLPLQRDSIALWGALQDELGRDFEMKVTGGLMVAETEAHMRSLAEKVSVEQRAGIDCRLIGQEELQAMEPALSPLFVGAAYCSQEGKINPLVATQHILEAARAKGVRVFDTCEVVGIASGPAGFEVTTSRGTIKAKRVVNAAGAFSSRIGSMLGLDIPVFGAPLQMVVTEAAAPLISRLVAHADRHLTLKQAANGNFIIGGGWTAGLDPVHQHPRPLLSSLEGNLWIAQHVVPALRKLHVIRSWAAMNINIDGAPILGEHPSQPGYFSAVTSNGYTLGPIVGQITAQLVLGRETGRALQPFSITRFGKGRS